ncbi:MAG: carboxypeptidase regulatory-like domain-containing protein [Bryobacteraceae bacterium]
MYLAQYLPRPSLTALVVLLAFFCATIGGQVNTATVTGTVTDPSGAAVPNAKIEATNNATSISTVVSTNNTGRFTLSFLPVGTYVLKVSSDGFQTEIRNNLTVTAGQVLDLAFALNVGDVHQNVTVAGEIAAALSYETVEQHTVVNEKNIHDLPLSKQDWTGLLQLDTAVVSAGNGNAGVSMNGLPPASFLLTVDGTSASSNPELPSVGFYQGFNQINTINTDAIAEVSITKGIAPASVSGMSGNVNIISRGGTNTLHGTLLEFNSLNDYNARNQFLQTNPRSTFNQFGASIGGAIIKNKLFYFLDYQGVRLSAFSALNGTVPTPLFAAEAIAAHPQYASIFSVFPLPNTPYASTALTATWNGAGSLIQNDNNAVGRIDYYLNANNWINLRYTDSHPSKLAPNLIAENDRASTGMSDSYNIQYTHTAATFTAATRAAYTRPDLVRLDLGYALGLDELEVNGVDSEGAENYQIRGGTFEVAENLSLTRGRHTLEFGGIIQRLNDGRIDDTTTTFSYSNTSDFLADIPNQVQINFPLSLYQLHMYQFGGFVQDAFHVTRNLTINMGLRYDYWTVPKERDGRLFNRTPTDLGVGTGPFRPAGSVYNSYWPNFGPRLGAAWAVGADRKTVIRIGAGIFYNPHTLYAGVVDDVLDNPNTPFRLTLSRAQALAQGLSFPLNKSAVLAQLEASGFAVAPTTINGYFPNPYSIQRYFGIQRELPYGLLLDTAYVGNRGVHISMTRTANLPDRLTGAVPDPQFGSFLFYDDSDASWYDSWQSSLSRRTSNGLTYGVSFTWAHNLSYGADDLQLDTVPQNFSDVRADKGSTPFDIQRSFRANFLYALPVIKWTGWTSRPVKLLVDGWQISGIFVANSGAPINITDNNSANPVDRPDLAPGINPIFSNYSSTLQYLNPAAFIPVPLVTASGEQMRPGNLGRDVLRAPGMWNQDLSIAKDFSITERVRLQLRGDAFNALNHTNLSGLTTNITSSAFGRLTSATPRSIQIGAKIIF